VIYTVDENNLCLIQCKTKITVNQSYCHEKLFKENLLQHYYKYPIHLNKVIGSKIAVLTTTVKVVDFFNVIRAKSGSLSKKRFRIPLGKGLKYKRIR